MHQKEIWIRHNTTTLNGIFTICILSFLLTSCSPNLRIAHAKNIDAEVTGTSFYKNAVTYNWKQRDSFFLESFYQGQAPDFFFRFIPVTIKHRDSLGNKYTIRFYCSPDYLSIGNNEDWARVPLTPKAAQLAADTLHCFLPTRKMVDLIYQQSQIKLAPVPMYAYRDSTITMWQHHLIIEGQRKRGEGLISGIKKDIVLCSKQALKGKVDRVAIYGWHQSDAKPIQSLYTGHVNWYVDYSHGARMIYRNIKVNGKWMDYMDFFKNPFLSSALSDDQGVLILRY